MKIGLVGIGIGVVFAAMLSMGSCTTIDTGNVGVKESFGQIDLEEVPAGFTFKAPMITSIDNYNVREVALDLQNLTPKAKDNLSLQDMDVSVFYEVEPSKVADIVTDFKGQTIWDDENDVWLPGRGLVNRFAREAVYDAVSKMESLTIHQKREQVVAEVKRTLQRNLDHIAPGTFRVTNIVIRAITTDPSIEQSIQRAVQAQKELEQVGVQKEIAEKRAEIAVAEARGQADANRVVNSSLTPELLKLKQIEAMNNLATSGNSKTIVMPSNATPLVSVN